MNGPPKVVDHDVTTNPEGETVNRLVLDVNGHDVQVLQYDDHLRVLVLVGKIAKMIHITKAARFIAGHTGEE